MILCKICWWGLAAVLAVEDLLTKRLSVWLLLLLGLVTAFWDGSKLWEAFLGGFSTQMLWQLMSSLLPAVCIILMMVWLMIKGKLGGGDFWMILFCCLLFPTEIVIGSLLFALIHVGCCGMIRMIFTREDLPSLPLVPFLGLGLWAAKWQLFSL